MRVLIIHNQFNYRSGPETYIRNICEIFKSKKIKYSFFSFKSNNLRSLSYYDKLPDYPVSNNSVSQSLRRISTANKLKIAKNSFFNNDVYKSLSNVLNIYNPDIVYLLQFHLKLSSSVIDACKKFKIPIVCRLSDFNFICANNILLRNGEICTSCLKNNFNQIKYNCLKNRSYSILDFLVRNFNQKRGIYNYINHFIIPSKHNKNILSGVDIFKNKITHIQSPYIIKNHSNISAYSKDPVYLNFGRQSYDKGIDILIDAFKKNNYKLKLIGEKDEFINNIVITNNIIFLDKMPFQKLRKHIANSQFCIHSSRWFDNLPNSLIEASTLGIPCIIPNFGSFKDLINSGMPCIEYEYGKLENALNYSKNLSRYSYEKLSAETFEWAKLNFNSEKHFRKLIKIFKSVLKDD